MGVQRCREHSQALTFVCVALVKRTRSAMVAFGLETQEETQNGFTIFLCNS